MSGETTFDWSSSGLHYEFPVPKKEDRFKELVLYIANECVDDPTFSKTKLLKILFFSDFESYGMYGTPITGMPYRKLPFGPCPVDFPRIQEEMVRTKLIAIHARRVYDLSSQRVLPLQRSTFNLLSGRDVAIVNGWIRHFWKWTAKRVSEYSHGKAWSLAQESKLIPYEAVFISDEPVTFGDIDNVRDLASRYGWKI